ncbi:MAG: MBL fold metallo-hydrolase [Rhodocyclaceae bacterium]|nr:MBL fold metallo-hydrolase [Rhodocyclaceae bacterium]
MSVKKVIVGLVGVIVVVAVLAVGFRNQIFEQLVTKTAAKRMKENFLADLPDGLHVGLCGAGSPLPDPKREPPCTIVVAGKRLFLIDAGSGAGRNIVKLGFNPGDIEAVFLTHFHSDHIDGLGELMLMHWGGRPTTKPLPIYGAAGVSLIVNGLNQVYSQDMTYRVAHHGIETMAPGGFGGEARVFETPIKEGRTVLLDEPDLQIVAFSVMHAPIHPAVGYRIRYKDRTMVISGDTAKSSAVQREAKGVDLLVHEALNPKLVGLLQTQADLAGNKKLAKIFGDIPNYHTPPEQVAEIARDAGVGYVLLTHVVPALPMTAMDGWFLGKSRDIFTGKLKVGADGDFVSMLPGSKEIKLVNRH